MIVVVASIKGAPGVTTTATALAAGWPADRRVLLVEADPFGGDLAAWFGLAPSTGLWTLLAAGRRGLDPHVVWQHATALPSGLPVLYGLASADQAVANEGAWPAVAQALAALDADVVIDAGRFLPHFAGGVGSLLSVAHRLVVLCSPTLAGVVHLKTALPSLTGSAAAPLLMVVPTAQKGFSSEEIATTLNVNVVAPLPHDPKGAAALSSNAIGPVRTKTSLARWARTTAAELVVSFPLTTTPQDLLSGADAQHQPFLSPPNDLASTSELAVSERVGDTSERHDAQAVADSPSIADRRNDDARADTPTELAR